MSRISPRQLANPANPHDRFFRELAADPETAAGLLENFLPPEVRPLLDIGSLEIQKDSFVEPDLRAYYSDLLYRVMMAGLPSYVYLLFEHKSHPDRRVHVQVLKYIKPIWEDRRERPLPVVIPIVIYHGRTPWPFDPQFSKVFPLPDPALRPYFPDFRIVLADLSQYSDEEIRGAVITRTFLLLLKHIRAPDFPDRMPHILGLLKGLARSHSALGHLEAMLRYIGAVAENITRETVERTLLELVPKSEGDRIMATLAEQYKQRGLEKGIEAIHSGIKMGLRTKFGKEGLGLMDDVRKIKDINKLESLLEDLWIVGTVDEFREKIQAGEK